MEPEFWHERWRENRIGFHQSHANRFLTRYFERLKGVRAGPIFVPLCGKSRDMAWLHDQGHEVVGVELSPLAAEAFFTEGGQACVGTLRDGFPEYHADGITILVGDYFHLTPARLGPVSAVYDRAALIAMPPDTRRDYAAHMAELLMPGAPVLLIAPFSLKDPQSGPPFAVSKEEVTDIFAPHFAIQVLEREREMAAVNPQLAEQGLAWREEAVYLLTRRERP
ncbi:MAG TPA: thiopurine S-methyltransferase [Acidiferrobacter sp.]|nr:thiopurine S-methyltransferase [Acidiferrobacter sp.]